MLLFLCAQLLCISLRNSLYSMVDSVYFSVSISWSSSFIISDARVLSSGFCMRRNRAQDSMEAYCCVYSEGPSDPGGIQQRPGHRSIQARSPCLGPGPDPQHCCLPRDSLKTWGESHQSTPSPILRLFLWHDTKFFEPWTQRSPEDARAKRWSARLQSWSFEFASVTETVWRSR